MTSLTTSARAICVLFCGAFALAAPLQAQTGQGTVDTGSSIDAPGGVKGKPTPTPTPAPTPKPDGETDWKNTGGTDWNTGTNWTAVSGSAPPIAGDVAWFKTAFSSGQPNLSASTSIAGFYFNGTGSSGYDITSSTTAIKFTLTGSSVSSGAQAENSDATANVIRADNTSGTNTIDAPIILGGAAAGNQAFVQARGGTLVLNGVISSTNSIAGFDLISNSTTGTATFTLAGANTYSGSTKIIGTNVLLNIN